MRSKNLCAWCFVCALAGCAGNGEGLDENGRPDDGSGGVLEPTFQSIQDHVFTPICTGCHAGAAAPLGLRLDEGASYALLVNTASVEVPSLRRVQPGNPDASYLIQKLEGTAAVGSRMPLNGTPLPSETIAVIRQWIANGAQNAVSFGAQNTVPQVAAVSPKEGDTLSASPADIVIAFDTEVDASLLQANLLVLRASGGDGGFAEGNEIALPVDVAVRSSQPTVLVITPRQALTPDTYQLMLSGTQPLALADLQGRAIDGDGDQAPGGDFVLKFSVETKP